MGIGIAILTNNDKMPNAKHLGGKPIGRQSGYDILGGGYVLGGTIMVVTGVVYLFR